LSRGLPIFTHLPAADDAEGQARLQVLLDRLADFPHAAAIETGVPAVEEGRTAAGWLTFRLPLPGVALRQAIWSEHLAGETLETHPTLAADLAAAFQLTDSQIREAAAAAATLARRRDVFEAEVRPDDFYAACRRLSAARLVAFAQRIEPRAKLTIQSDIVLPPANKRALIELRHRIHHHARVHGAFGLGPHMRLGRGVIALFVGGSGTGKTIAAEILASEQHVDLYRVDLAALSSKWVGETERNLSKVFADAERANCMLFFDEADSVFSRRGEVREARDRWANLETNYVLQRIEEYSGVVILATNFRQNLDEAFQRRIHVVVDFPVPDVESRRALWTRLLPASPHLSITEADLDDLAARFELTGGNIRNIVLDACFRALSVDQATVTLRHVVASIAREYQKGSRPVTEGDFGRHYEWAMRDVILPEESSVGAEA
jgi:SpoVK/Ycf46/Vps4 family AAA+-type ATPase